MVVEHAVMIKRPLVEVWAVFDDPDELLEWQDSLVGYERVEGEPGEIGSVSRQIIERSGGETDLTVTLVDRRPPEFSKSQYEGLRLPFTIANTFTAIDGGSTEWHAVLDVRLSLMQKALAPVLKNSLEDLAEQNAENFRRYVERR